GIKQVVYMKQAVGRRTFTAALSKGKLFAMEYTTSVLIICITGIIGMVVYQIIYHIDFMSAWVGCIGLLIGASLMTTLLGMTIGLYVKEEDMGGNILSLIVTLSAILSGKLMPMFELGDVTQLSPIKPLIEALEELVQYGRFSNGDVLLVYLVGVLGILGGLVVIKLKRQEEVQ
ncbi:MAG: ABC transporter permease, partial [Niameybacter sp.]